MRSYFIAGVIILGTNNLTYFFALFFISPSIIIAPQTKAIAIVITLFACLTLFEEQYLYVKHRKK